MSIPCPGWYIYTPRDPKNPKLTLRWVTVTEFWLEVSPKPTEQPLITFHLGFCDIAPPLPEENPKLEGLPVNRLIVKTRSFLGDFPTHFVLATHNRFDILDLNEAMVQGKKAWDRVLNSGMGQRSFEGTFRDKKGGFLSKEVECLLSAEGFRTSRGAESTTVELRHVVFVRPLPYDTPKRASVEMKVSQPGLKPDLLFQCRDHAEMRTFVAFFLFLLTKQRPSSSE
jgi:hypothetical protein